MNREVDKTIASKLNVVENKETGMTMITASTGKGKTTAIIEFAIEAINRGRFEKVVFIEPRHTILSYVYEKLQEKGVKGILYLNNAKDNALKHYKEVNIKAIKDTELKDKTEALLDNCELYEYLEKQNNNSRDSLDDLIFKNKSDLKKYCLSKRSLNSIELDEIKKLFPEEVSKDHKFILMTMDKLFFTLDVLKKENRILSSRIFDEKTLVVIDELDKCYAIALNQAANNRDTLEDMLSVIQNAYAFISERDQRWQTIADDEYNSKIEEAKQKLLEEIDELNNEYGVLNNFVYEQRNDERLELFVSRAKTFIATKKKRFKLIKGNQKTTIRPSNEKTDFSVKGLAIGCKKTVRHILNFIYLLGEAYRKLDNDASYEDGLYYGISQVFNKTLAESDYYLNYAIDNTIKTQSLRIDEGEFIDENSVCNNGFSHCIFENKPGTNHTYVTSSGIDLTPENIFIWLAKKANVICASATQQISTVASLDLDYCKKVLGDSFDAYSREEFEEANSNLTLDNERIICDVISLSTGRREELYEQLALCLEKTGYEVKPEIKDILFEATDSIDQECGDSDFKRNREYKRFLALCKFAFEKRAISGLIIFNSYYNTKPFKHFISQISSLYGAEVLDLKNIYTIKADNIEAHLKDIKDKLNNGIRCLVISNKEALGQGVNIQYDKDFNFFYQEEPTNILPVPKYNQPLSETDRNKLVYLVMKMAANGEIDDGTMAGWISRVTENGNHESRRYSSIKNAKTSIFIQGLGRTSRTENKEKYEFIYFDEALCDVLDFENIMVEKTPELFAVEMKVKEYNEHKKQSLVDSMSSIEKQLCENSNRLQRKINDLLTTFTGQNMTNERLFAQAEYKRILDTIYKYGIWPTEINPEDMEIIEKIGYVKCDEPIDLWVYSDCENYCEDLLSISKDSKSGFHKINYDSVLKIKGYDKPVGQCWIINPKAFNLLQGVVGERKFKEVFERETEFYQLEEPSLDEYEICGDFKVSGTNIYIDVKNFNEDRGTIDMKSFALSKLDMIHERNEDGKLIIVNTYAKNKYESVTTDEDEILVISNVIGELGIKNRNNISRILDWIDDEKE